MPLRALGGRSPCAGRENLVVMPVGVLVSRVREEVRRALVPVRRLFRRQPLLRAEGRRAGEDGDGDDEHPGPSRVPDV